jgi:hypothetical protein
MDPILLSKYILEEIMQFLDVSSLAPRCRAHHRHWPLLGPTRLVLVVEKAKQA